MRKKTVVINKSMAVFGYGLLAGLLTFSPLLSQASTNNHHDNGKKAPIIHAHLTQFGVELGATRVIYNPTRGAAALLVNNKQQYPVLVQSKVVTTDLKHDAPFVVTPPLFRLNPNQQSQLRIVQTGGDFPNDRESLRFLCVKAVPPTGNSAWEQDPKQKVKPSKEVNLNINVVMNKCIVFFIRPSAIQGNPMYASSHVAWSVNDHHLIGKNDSPFYISLSKVMLNGESLKDIHYIHPFSSYSFTLPKNAKEKGKIQWQVISDLGGDSKLFESTLS